MTTKPAPHEAPAQALAAVVAASGPPGQAELTTLQALDAYRRLRISRERFVELVQACADEPGGQIAGQSWLSLAAQTRLDRALDAVQDRADRLLVCRLAAAAITADGHVTAAERLAYDHARARWHITASEVTQAILHDPAGRGAA